ncbi:methyltransferase domain-containing protein [Taibaiella chishuiensis]|uniref:Trans-aconitate 2-methyltransferase n=1 Tax=Taibaiella chishuiensis TaxID=1434707 RepID=A0A2P8D3Z2_9BACT|nr:methyltransferase domain-containing protein [Taibaiella chishuiensis]PSK91948.1 trans-aconitate 2-methyltransferase [Taibaiella chishuiensis]
MAWNPGKYNEFKSVRFKPFFDLAALIEDRPGMEAVDLGCGTGEQTAMLAGQFADMHILGIDSSAEMLAEAESFRKTNVSFALQTIEQTITTGKQWDLVFSNAALQWVDNHEQLFPALLARLKPGGQVAIQMPCQEDNLLNRLLYALAGEEPFCTALQGWNRRSPVLSMDDYAQLLFAQGGQEITVLQKVYPLIAASHDDLFQFISGSALIPYLDRLEGPVRDQFVHTFRQRIAATFPVVPALYAFKRILLYAQY